MWKVPRLEDRGLTSFSESDLAGKHIPNAGTNVVMGAAVSLWSKRHFGGSQFELTVKLNQMAEDNLFEFDCRRDAPRLYALLSRQGTRAKQQYEEQQL